MNNPDYIGALRPRLPPEALRPYPRACIAICIHFAIVIGCVIASLYTASGRWFVLGLVAGNSRAALSFLAHDVSHRSVVTSRYLIYPLELFLLSPVLTPLTVWRKVHQAHHAHTNSDPDPGATLSCIRADACRQTQRRVERAESTVAL
jgi:fatty acid desaturase